MNWPTSDFEVALGPADGGVPWTKWTASSASLVEQGVEWRLWRKW